MGQAGRVLVGVVILGGLALMVGAGFGRNPGAAQTQTQRNPGGLPPVSAPAAAPSVLPSDDTEFPLDMNGPMRARLNEDRVKALNDARHKRLEDDAAKLQALTSELKSDVDKGNEGDLSVEDMRKTSEIEKLAHDVQSRMKN